MIERTNGGVKRSRRNALDYEKTTASSEAMIRITMTKLMLNRLTDVKPEFPFRYHKKVSQNFLDRLSNCTGNKGMG